MIKRITRRLNCPVNECRQKCLSLTCLINIIFCTSIMFAGANFENSLLFCLGFTMAGINIYDLFMRPIKF